ncbi:MAG: bifunctional DNA primase/polymerase [Candidatus Bipolaricaulis sp.]|nr:bifunctional DNA primase/polymerase [Candidatus Bipolaricaulis sp.]
MLEAALKYHDRGYCVIPIKPGTKDKPLVAWTPYQDRKSTREEIIQWWTKTPSANIAVITGKISGVCMVDLDKHKPNYDANAELEYFENIVAPCAKTPKGGLHLIFKAPEKEISGKANMGGLTGIDFRCDGNYWIAPPSIRAEGKYEWVLGMDLDGATPPPLPAAYINKISTNYKEIQNPYLQNEQSLQFLQIGQRDEDIFHIANCLAKGGLEKNKAEKVIEIIAGSCNPPFDFKQALAKIESAYTRSDVRESTMMNAIRGYVSLQDSDIFLTEAYETLQILHPREKATAQVCFHRLCQDKVLEKIGRGHFRKVVNLLQKMNLFKMPTKEFPVRLPLDLNSIAGIYPENIIVIAGSKSSGKTTFLLNIVVANQHLIPVVYLNTEMGDVELTRRLELFGGKESDWVFEPYRISSDAEMYSLITGEPKIFIIDFLEQHDNFYKIGEKIREIHSRLKDGICVIALQKDMNAVLGRGKDFSLEKARLYLTLDYLKGQSMSVCKIIDAKEPKGRDNVRDGFRNYKILRGSSISPVTDWRW